MVLTKKTSAPSEKPQKKKKKYLPSAFLIIIALMLIFIVISWIIKAAGGTTTISVTEQYIKAGQIATRTVEKTVAIQGLGILDTLTAIWHGFESKADIILFIFSVGALLAVMTKTKAIDAGISKVVKKLNGKEILIIPVLMIIFGLGGSTYGMWEETIAFFPILIPVFIKMGYGPITAVFTILLGCGAGNLASTINPFSVGIAVEQAQSQVAGVSQGTLMGIRWISFVIFEAIAIIFVIIIGLRIKSKKTVIDIDEAAIAKKFAKEDNIEFTLKRKITLSIFIFGFIIMVLAYLPWTTWLSKGDLSTFSKSWNKNAFWIATSSADGSAWANWGSWYLISVTGVFLMITLVVFAINHKDFVDPENPNKNKETIFLETYFSGAKDVLSVCLLIAVASGLGYLLRVSHIGPYIANSIKGIGNIGVIGFGLVIFFMSLLLSILLPSTSGFAAAFIPIFVAIAAKAFPNDQINMAGYVILAFIFASGVANLFTPTSSALMAYTAYSGIPYNIWIKSTWKIILIFFVVSIIIMVIVGGMLMKGVAF